MVGALRVIQVPAEEPLSTDELRDHFRVLTVDEEPLIAAYLTALRTLAEKQLDLAFLSQTLEWTIDGFPCYDEANPFGSIELPRKPLQSVTSIKYIDQNGTQQTWSSSLYLVDTLQSRITPAYGQTYPFIRYQPSAVVIRYIAGYNGLALVPEDLRQMLRLGVATLFEFRESILEGTAASIGVVEQFFGAYQNSYIV